MRKVIAVNLVSLAGIMEAANAKGMAAEGGEQEPLEFASSETFSTGVVSLAYRPSGERDS